MGLISLAAGSWWYEIWISLWLLICQGIYIFIGALYQVFEKVASVNLFSVDVFTQITSRMYIVMGLAMLFISKVTYIGEKIAEPYSFKQITPNFKFAGL